MQYITSTSYEESINKSLMLDKKKRDRFLLRHYKIWKKPLDLIAILIGLSYEYGEEMKNKLANNSTINNPRLARSDKNSLKIFNHD